MQKFYIPVEFTKFPGDYDFLNKESNFTNSNFRAKAVASTKLISTST